MGEPILFRLSFNQFSSLRFHEFLVLDFFGLSRAELNAQNLQFIGWGFSYQARDPYTNALTCDFEFQSGTFNRGDLFDGILVEVDHSNTRNLQGKMTNFLRLNFNYMRSHRMRNHKSLYPLVDYVEYFSGRSQLWNKEFRQKLPRCPKPNLFG